MNRKSYCSGLMIAILGLAGTNAVHAADPKSVGSSSVQLKPSGSEGDGDVRIGPKYQDAPELTPKEGTPRGALHEFTMTGSESRIYPGIKGDYKRKVCVYVPAQYTAGMAAPFLIVQDSP
jgi:hypothetical protein